MRYRALIFLLLLFNVSTVSAENIRWRVLPNREIQFLVLYQENGKFLVELFKKEPGKFQQKVRADYFNRKSDALEYLQKLRSFTEAEPEYSLTREDLSRSTGQVIWETKNQWSMDWEKKYSAWLKKNADSEFLKKYNIATDCADVPFAFRWIFSRINKLPAANQLMGTGQIFSNESMINEWENLPTSRTWHRDRRFMAALRYVLNNTYTHSLMNDSYPVRISPASFSGGVTFLDLYSQNTGHTQFLYNVILDPEHHEPLRALASTVPKELRDLYEYGFQGPGDPLEQQKSALVKFRWPVRSDSGWILRKPEEMPDFSLEQFQSDFLPGYTNIAEAAIFRIMPNWNPDYKKALKSKVALILEKFRERVQIVKDGNEYCLKIGGCPYGSESYEIWSTPSRDQALEDLIYYMQDIYDNSRCSSSCQRELDSKANEIITNINGKSLTLEKAINIWNKGDYDSNPNSPIPVRWGME